MSAQGSGPQPPRCKQPYPEDRDQYHRWEKTAAQREIREELTEHAEEPPEE